MPPLLFSCVVTVSQVVGHQVACSYWPRCSCMAFEHWAHPLICPTTFSPRKQLSDEFEALDRQLQEEKMS